MSKPAELIVWGLLILNFGQAQDLSIISGNGQLICPRCPDGTASFEPLVVQVTRNGQPLQYATVIWTIVEGNGTLAAGQTVSDANGRSSNTLTPTMPPVFSPATVITQNIIRVKALTSAVVFTETLAQADLSGASQIVIRRLEPLLGEMVNGPVGERGQQPIQVMVLRADGGGVPGVEIRLVPDPALPQTIACDSVPGLFPGTVLSEPSGVANCIPVFGGKAGFSQFTIHVGGRFQILGPSPFRVATGVAAMLRVISGNDQSANIGAPLASPLVAEVSDVAGNPVSGAAVTWRVIRGSATLRNTTSSSGSAGRVSAEMVLGQAAGAVEVRLEVTGKPGVAVTFSATALARISQLQKLAGDGQEAPVNTRFPQALVAQVSDQGRPVRDAALQFEVTSGSAGVGSPPASTFKTTTDSLGRASTSVTAGAAPGPVTITATAGGFSQLFRLNVRPAGPANLRFLNAASYQQDLMSPCSVAAIVGDGLAPGIQGTVVPAFFGPLPYQVARVTVHVGGFPAPIYAVSNSGGSESVTVQVPCEAEPGVVSVEVRAGDYASAVEARVLPVSPGIFEAAMSDNRRRAVMVRPNGSFVNLASPAIPGEVLRMYVTGLGRVDPPVRTNQRAAETGMRAVNLVVINVNEMEVPVLSAQYSHDLIGVYIVDFEVPANTPSGNDVAILLGVQAQGSGELVFASPSTFPVR